MQDLAARDREIGHGQILWDNSGLFQMLFNDPTDSSPTGTAAFAQPPKLSQVARSELTIRYVKPILPPILTEAAATEYPA